MAKSKAELMAEKLQKQRVGKTAFEAGSKPAIEIPENKSEPDVIVTEPVKEDLVDFVAPTKTQGRKGQKTPRMNLAIPEDVYEYIRRESKKEGMTYSEFICAVMRQRQSNNK